MTGTDDLTNRKAGLSEAKRALLRQRLQGKKPPAEPSAAIKSEPQVGPMPLSYTQQRVWFLQQLFPENLAYNMHEAWRVRGPLDLKALGWALNEVLRRQASLRTSFVTVGEQPMQVVAQSVTLPLPLVDLTDRPFQEREEALRELVVAGGNYAFDLGAAPLLRMTAVRLGEEEHALLLVLHHIITDEWSNDIFWRELAALYAEARDGQKADLTQLPIQYSDYARWQREQVEEEAFSSQMAYWQARLTGEPGLLQLPHDRARPAEQSLRGGIIRRSLPTDLLAGLQALCQEHGTTLYMTLAAAFQALLHRYSGQEDILVGTPIANRQRPETADVMGMFINTAVLRADLTGNPTFLELLAQTRQATLEALANQDLPFDVLVQAKHPERDLSYNPLFQTMFVFRSEDVARSLPDTRFEPIRVDRGVSKFDLTMFAGEVDGRFLAALEYSGDLFEAATVERMLDHWQALLAGIVADPRAPVASLPLLTAAERELVTRTWNETAVPLNETRPLHVLIAAQAARQPQAEAVISAEERLTYGELDRRANSLAQQLIKRGVQAGTPVGLYVERSADMIVGILGILKAGGAYVPLEPAYPAERIAFALADTGATVIVTQSRLAQDLPPTDAQIFLLESVAAHVEEPPATAVSRDDLAYIIYTSGSTGTPKGVMVTHGNLLASTLAREEYYGEPVGRYLLLSSFAFDSSVAGIFWTLAGGGALVLPAPDEEKDVPRLASLIAAEKVTHTLALPSLYRLLLAYAPPGSLASLRTVIVAGEACPPDLGEEHYGLLPHCALYNEYGPTEATVWCSVYRVPEQGDGGVVPIGRPIANSQLYILDSNGQPLPVGVPGELYVGGAGVTPGYWYNAELTAERFPTVDFVSPPLNGRLYRTGDLARWQADGNVQFLGRVDNQVKIRGFRIELGEIEALLLRHPAVREAVVTVWEQPGMGASPDRSLVAYVAADRPIDHAQLQAYLGELLPEYMVPRQVMTLAALPHTPNGKIDRKQLPQPQIERDGRRPFVAARTANEEILARIWREILRLPQVSVEDKFFELGGDSLMTIQVIARARQEGLVLTPRQVFQEQTIARLAAVAKAAEMQRVRAATSGPVPLTPIQHWFFAQALTQPAHWNQGVWLETAVELDPASLRRALDALVAHHPMLRARFQQVEGVWRQEVLEQVPGVTLEVVSLAGLSTLAQDEELLATANRLHAALDLAEAPLLRAAWFDLGPARAPRLFLTVHHLVVDAVSWGILLPDLQAAYAQIAAGRDISLPAPATGYAEWAALQAQLVPSAALQAQLPYWRDAAGVSGSLPQDGAGGSNVEGEARLVTVSLDEEHTGQLLREAHEAYNTRIDDLLLAALARALQPWTGSQSLLLTLERHGREEIDPQLDISQTVGWFTTLFPHTVVLPENDDEGVAIRAVKEQLRAVPDNGIGYGMLRYLGDAAIQEELALKPQPEILLNYLGLARQADQKKAPFRPVTGDTGLAYGPQNKRAHLIDVNARVENGRLVARWQYAPACFQETTVAALAQAFITELSQLVRHCLTVEQGQHTPSDFPLADLQQDDLDTLADLLDGLG